MQRHDRNTCDNAITLHLGCGNARGSSGKWVFRFRKPCPQVAQSDLRETAAVKKLRRWHDEPTLNCSVVEAVNASHASIAGGGKIRYYNNYVHYLGRCIERTSADFRRIAVCLIVLAAKAHKTEGKFSCSSNMSLEQMKQPVVSVVMVVCNVDRFLAEAIESIVSQTFTEFEFIIVDFGSTDRSISIISSYAAKDCRLKFHEIPHCGLAAARNAVCSLARGTYLAVMDADDVSVPERLMWQVGFMEEHPEVGVLGGAVEWIDAAGKALMTREYPAGDREIQSALPKQCPLWQPTVLMRRNAFVRVGGYRPPFAPAEDYDLWLRMAEHFQFANLERVVLRYRIHPGQVSIRKLAQQTFGALAARISASSRKAGAPDPLSSVGEITSDLLAGLGVTEAMQEQEIALYRYGWIRNMCLAGEYSVALRTANDMLQSDLKHVERWVVADLRLLTARMYWKQGKLARCLLAAVQAIITRPQMLARPLKPILRKV